MLFKSNYFRIYLFIVICTLPVYIGCNSTKDVKHSKRNLTVLTYNIHHANPPSVPELIDVKAISDVLKKSNADVVLLQEVDNMTNRSGRINQAKEISKLSGYEYFFYKAIDYDDGEYGLAILTKLPARRHQTIKLPQVIEAEKRILALLEVKVNNSWICFANTHLDALRKPEDRNRIAQAQFISDKAREIRTPIILGGDLNSLIDTEAIKILETEFEHTCIENCALTVPEIKPRARIDYILTRNIKWQLDVLEVIPETYASDHRPVKAIFKW